MSVKMVASIDDKEVSRYLVKMSGKSQDMTKLFKSFGGYMLRSVNKNFRVGGRPDKWEKSARAKTVKRGKTLVKTGRLKNSITYEASKDELVIGTNVKYARIHQLGFVASNIEKATVGAHWRLQKQAFGKSIPPRSTKVREHKRRVVFNMPARPFLVVQDEDFEHLENLSTKYLVDK